VGKKGEESRGQELLEGEEKILDSQPLPKMGVPTVHRGTEKGQKAHQKERNDHEQAEGSDISFKSVRRLSSDMPY